MIFNNYCFLVSQAYRGCDDKIRLFRPMQNMERMLRTAKRACFPAFDGEELLECIQKLVQIGVYLIKDESKVIV